MAVTVTKIKATWINNHSAACIFALKYQMCKTNALDFEDGSI